MILTIIMFILIFGVIVISHEFGHFLLAKVNGIHVVEFAVGKKAGDNQTHGHPRRKHPA